MFQKINIVIIVAVLLSVLWGVIVAESVAAIGGRIVNPDPQNARSQSIFVYTLTPGQVKHDQLLVINNTDSKKTINIGSVDGIVTDTGHYTCRQASEAVTGSGSWVTLSKTSVTLPAGGEEKVDFTVTVPENPDVGEHNSCLTMQADEEVAAQGSGVKISMRQAIRMVTTIPGELTRSITIDDFTVDASNGEQQYVFTVANKGNVSADVDMQVHLRSLLGREITSAGGEYPIIPNQHLVQRFTTTHSPLFGGWYDIVPSVRYDKRLGVFGTRASVEYETKIGQSTRIYLPPTVQGVIIIIVATALVAAGVVMFLVRRSRMAAQRRQAHRHVVVKGDTVQAIAEAAGVGWKDVVRINKLTAPYTLQEGGTILVPNNSVHKDSGSE